MLILLAIRNLLSLQTYDSVSPFICYFVFCQSTLF